MSFLVKSPYTGLLRRNSINFSVILKRKYPAPVKRFYKNVHVSEADGKFEVSLDKRRLKTPLGIKLLLPNEALAIAVATEWDSQQDTLQQHAMHITALCNTAIDNPCKRSVENLTDDILQFLSSDTICFRSNEPFEFAELQKKEWDPLLRWFEKRYNIKLNICEDVSGIPVSENALGPIKRHMLSYSSWCLLGLHFMAENLKSLILTKAVSNHVIDVEKAVSLSRLETLFQIKQWGTVEWAHTVDEAQIKARVAAGALFTYLNESSSDSIAKNTSEKIQMFGSSRL